MSDNTDQAGASGLVRLWHEDITGMVAGARLYPEQTEYVLVADYDTAIASLKRERDQLTAGLAALCECYTGVLDAGNKALKERDGLREALKSLRNNIDSGLLTALRNGGQLDMDGCEVRVSRQACEEAANHLEQLATLSPASEESK